eukprot:TRINITY_DN1219_c1_g1_i1.p1 TRINITY_DN1219_c1_g1~~TRINITY_DN1219_c1_g1_i1.p1  ORF type:complete len:268 (-),score=68.79 TRINITY_DN1219_c1_g1_i1:82-885(-)
MSHQEGFWQKFVLGGVACMVPLPVMNPIEVVKIRLQVQGEMMNNKMMMMNNNTARHYRGFGHGILTIASEEGVRGLYKGFTPALMREGVYASTRAGLYEPVKYLLGEDSSTGGLPFYKKLVAGAMAGGLGAAVATPSDVVKVQMQAEGPVPSPRYRNTFHAFSTIWKSEGIRGLYKGIVPTTQRAFVISAAMMPSYDQTKHFLLDHGWVQEGPLIHVISGLTAGFVMAAATNPVDVVKTRIMNQHLHHHPSGGRYLSSWPRVLQIVG